MIPYMTRLVMKKEPRRVHPPPSSSLIRAPYSVSYWVKFSFMNTQPPRRLNPLYCTTWSVFLAPFSLLYLFPVKSFPDGLFFIGSEFMSCYQVLTLHDLNSPERL